MRAMPYPENDAGATVALASDSDAGVTFTKTVSLADANSGETRVAPPHVLWETLETAFSDAEISPSSLYGSPVPEDRRLAGYIALPIALGLSLVLWVAIVEFVLTR